MNERTTTTFFVCNNMYMTMISATCGICYMVAKTKQNNKNMKIKLKNKRKNLFIFFSFSNAPTACLHGFLPMKHGLLQNFCAATVTDDIVDVCLCVYHSVFFVFTSTSSGNQRY